MKIRDLIMNRDSVIGFSILIALVIGVEALANSVVLRQSVVQNEAICSPNKVSINSMTAEPSLILDCDGDEHFTKDIELVEAFANGNHRALSCTLFKRGQAFCE